ncbi:MAG TPA: sensor histidine kinase [Candidatus Hypogeohydataceae bacterium YC40]
MAMSMEGLLSEALFVLFLSCSFYLEGNSSREQKASTVQSPPLSTLAAGLAHELRTPLSTISLNLQLLQEELQTYLNGQTGPLLNRISILQKEIQRLEEVLSDFLRFAKGGNLELTEQDTNQVVGEVMDFIAPEAKRNNIKVIRDFTPNLPIVRMDSGLMKQAILNLIINAQQAMPQGGKLSVNTSLKRSDVLIKITDTGVGIPTAQLDKIFQAFFSTKKKGTGLGLPTVKRIVEEHGGSISVVSKEGEGSSFTILLPIGRD